MGSLEAMSANLELLDLKRDSLNEAILMLALEWKKLDELLECTENCSDVGQILAAMEEKHRVLWSQEESLAESKKELDLVEESLNVRLEELDCREEKFRSFEAAKIEEYKMREEKLTATHTWVVERVEEFGSKEEKLDEQKKLMEGLLESIEREKEQLLNIEKSLEKKLNLIDLRERHCKDKCQEIDAIKYFVWERAGELDSREKQVGLREKHVEAMQKTNEKSWKEHEMTQRERSNVLDSVGDLLERKAKELGEREKQVRLREKKIMAVPFNEGHLKELETRVQDRYKVLDSLRDLMDTCAKQLDLGGRQVAINKFMGLQEKIYDQIREFVKRGKHLNAIKYVCMFELEDDFPPAALLKGYISNLEEEVEKIRKDGHYTLKAQDTAIKKELTALKQMMNSVKFHKLYSEYEVESLEACIEQLKRQKTDIENFISTPPNKAQPKKRSISQKREIHMKKRKNFVLEHTYDTQTTHAHFGEQLPPDDVPCHLILPFCFVGSAFDPSNIGQFEASALVEGGFSSSEQNLGTDIEFPLLQGWSSTWP